MKAIHHVRSDKVPLGIEIEKMNIVLDTNIIYRDWYLSGINFGLLEKFLKQSNAKLFVPEIVVLEAKNKFKQELIKSVNSLVKNLNQFQNLLPKENVLKRLPNVVERCCEYDAQLDKRLDELKAEMPGHSDVSQEAIVTRALAPRKPFRESDKGYRDALLWEVILHKIATKDKSTFLISTNYKDFANKPTDRLLHSNLKEDLVSAGLPENSVQFYSNLKSFIEEQVRSKLKVTPDEIVQSLKEGSYKGFSLDKWFIENRDAIAVKLNKEISSAFVFTPINCESDEPTVTCIEEVGKVYIYKVTHYEGDEQLYHIDVSATLTMAVDVIVSKAAYYSHLCEAIPLDVWDSDWNEWCVWAVIEELKLPVSFFLVFDAFKESVENFEVMEVGEIWGWCRFCNAQIMSEAAEECWSCGKSFF